jgi:hypothetical protein
VQPGDGPAVIAQKRRARAALAASMARESGNALVEEYGEEAPNIINTYKARAQGLPPPAAAGGGHKVGDVVTMKDGRRVKITTILPNGKFQGVPVQ